MKHFLILASLLFFSKFSFAGPSEKDPRVIVCPDPFKGEATIVYRENNKKKPWYPLKWSCTSGNKVVSSSTLEEKINETPPLLNDPLRKWDEACPRGSSGVIRYTGNNTEYRPENWTCTIDGGRRLDWPLLKSMVERENASRDSEADISGASGLSQRKVCPKPYQGTYIARFLAPRWVVSKSECVSPGATRPVNEIALQQLVDATSLPIDSLPQ